MTSIYSAHFNNIRFNNKLNVIQRLKFYFQSIFDKENSTFYCTVELIKITIMENNLFKMSAENFAIFGIFLRHNGESVYSYGNIIV